MGSKNAIKMKDNVVVHVGSGIRKGMLDVPETRWEAVKSGFGWIATRDANRIPGIVYGVTFKDLDLLKKAAKYLGAEVVVVKKKEWGKAN